MDPPEAQQLRYYSVKKGRCRSCKKRKARKGRALCRVCNQRKLDWYHANREKVKAQQLVHREKLKLEAYAAYGGARCACCGEKHIEFLTIDHVKGNGAEHRRALGAAGRGYGFYAWLRSNRYPKGYQVLCMNCNFAKGVHGGCPHEKGRKLYVAR